MADHLGAHSVWLSEHHLFEDGHRSQPLALAAAIAPRTRSGPDRDCCHGRTVSNGAQLAEESALVDVLLTGRLELGLGAGYRAPEFDPFGAQLKQRYEVTDERVRGVRTLWQDPRMLPGPVQPHPRICLGYKGPRGARRAGVFGESLLSIDRKLIEPYVEGLCGGGHGASQARMADGINAWISNDPDAEWPIVVERLAYQWDSYRRYMLRALAPNNLRPSLPIGIERAALVPAQGTSCS